MEYTYPVETDSDHALLLFLNFSKMHFTKEQPRIENLLYLRRKKSFLAKSYSFLQFSKLVHLGSCKILTEY